MIRKLALVIALACAAFIIFATLSPIQLRPKTGHFNIERFAAFFVLGAAFVTAYPKYWLIVAIGVVTGACGLEIGQLYVPGRDGDVHDAILKSFGGLRIPTMPPPYSDLMPPPHSRMMPPPSEGSRRQG